MTLAWTSVQPADEGYYWVSRPGSTEFEIVYLRDGECSTGRDGNPVEPAGNFDLWAWPVQMPPAPVRAPLNSPADTQPAKDTLDVPPTAQA